MGRGGGFYGRKKGVLRNLTMVVFKFDHGQNIIRPWCFLNSTMVKFLNPRRIVPKGGWDWTKERQGRDRFEGVKSAADGANEWSYSDGKITKGDWSIVATYDASAAANAITLGAIESVAAVLEGFWENGG